MISYEVTLQLEDPALAEALVEYMTGKHVAEVFATGLFLDARFEQSADLYRSRYTLASQDDLDRYVAGHAPRLRADFLEHFPAGIRITRAVWHELQVWMPRPSP